jgi:hypothetical protein
VNPWPTGFWRTSPDGGATGSVTIRASAETLRAFPHESSDFAPGIVDEPSTSMKKFVLEDVFRKGPRLYVRKVQPFR